MSRTKLIKTPRTIKRINSLIACTLLTGVRQYQKKLKMIFYEHIFNFKIALVKQEGKFSLIRMLTMGYNLFRKRQVVKCDITCSESLTTQQQRFVSVWGSATWDTKWEMKYKLQSITRHEITLGIKSSFIDTLHWEKTVSAQKKSLWETQAGSFLLLSSFCNQ